MRFVVSSSSFLMRLQAVSKVISGKPAQPILDNILLVAKDDMLYATASDKETTMEAKIELDNLETPGSITIPAKLLLDILKEFPEQPLTFDINTGTNEVKIISDKGEFSVPGRECRGLPGAIRNGRECEHDNNELRYVIGGDYPYGFRHGK